jgi:hypothetical protein
VRERFMDFNEGILLDLHAVLPGGSIQQLPVLKPHGVDAILHPVLVGAQPRGVGRGERSVGLSEV